MPGCFSMLLSVPIGTSRTGCGTVTRPGLTGCLNCLWLPTCATSYQPSCFKRCMTSRLDIRHNTHFLHTCQVGIYRISAGDLQWLLPSFPYLIKVVALWTFRVPPVIDAYFIHFGR